MGVDFGISEAIAVAGLAASAASAGAAAIGANKQAQAQAEAANYQSQVAKNNQVIANQNADAAVRAGAAQEAQKRTDTFSLEGKQRASIAANGLDVNSGSGLDLQAGTAATGELDAETIRDTTAKTASGFRVQGLNYQAEAGIDQMKAQNAASAGALNSFASILGGASSVGDKWARYKTSGIFGSGGGGGRVDSGAWD